MTIAKRNFGKARTVVRAFSLFVALAWLGGCGTVEHRIQKADTIALDNGFSISNIQTSTFPLYSAQRIASNPDAIHIVIEGDGYAWVDRFRPSDNPTPLDPIGLKIASALSGDVIYLGRPCQYIDTPRCSPFYWTDKRFAPEVLSAFDDALNQIKARHSNAHFTLSGFSGGAYIAMRLAEIRSDVRRVNTVAGLLDPAAWTDYHGLSPLSGLPAKTPVNPNTQYMHICGGDDDVIPCALTRRFVAAHPEHQIKALMDEDHSSLWRRALPYL